MISIIITDDHPLVVEGLKNILNNEVDLQVTTCFSDGRSTLAALQEYSPDILLLDINLPDMNSIDIIESLMAIRPNMKIILLSVHNEYAVINSVLGIGAHGYIQKNATGSEIIQGIHHVLQGKRFLCSQSKAILQKKQEEGLKSVPKITRREREILIEASNGLTTAEIAEKLFISPHTVESHRKNLIEKFEVKNLSTAIKLAFEYGLIRQ